MQTDPSPRQALFPGRAWLTPLLVAVMLCAMALMIGAAVHGESVTWDEGDHLFAGYMSLRTGDFGLNPEHPPMAKMVGALPLVGLPLKVPPLQGRFFKAEAYDDGREFLFRNAPQQSLTAPLAMSVPTGQGYTAQQLIFRARLAMLVFPLTMALLVFWTAREMFGEAAGLLAMLLAVTEPNLLAHGSYVTTDSAATCCFLGAIFAFYRYCKVPTWPRLLVAGVAGGLALAAKHSTVFLLPMLVLLIAVEVGLRWWARRMEAVGAKEKAGFSTSLRSGPNDKVLGGAEATSGWKDGGWKPVLRDAAALYAALLGILVVAVLVLWCFYGWRFSARPHGRVVNPSLAVACSQIRPLEGRILMGIAHLRLLPESYLYGLADIRNLGNTWPSYLFGTVYAHGVWWYFPVSLLIKSTLPELALLLLAFLAIGMGRLQRAREVLFLLVPATMYLLVAIQSGLNIGMRHVLPLYPLAIVLAAGGALALSRGSRVWQAVVAVLLCFQAFTSLHAFPSYLEYSNEAFGGPAETHNYVTDSSVDWVQQLIAVKAYVQAHGIHDCWFAYWAYPAFYPKDYGIPCNEVPTWDSMGSDEVNPVPVDITGPVFLSHGALTGYEYKSALLNPLAQFVPMKPVAAIQDGLFVYDGEFHVPEVAAMSHLTLSRIALRKKDVAAAVAEGAAAVALWPNGVEQREQMGDALHAAGRDAEARQNYQVALDRVNREMEPSGKAVLGPELEGKIAAAR